MIRSLFLHKNEVSWRKITKNETFWRNVIDFGGESEYNIYRGEKECWPKNAKA